MLPFNLLVFICISYVAILFAVAALAERSARLNKMRFLKSPLVYTLSISVYCTAWTFYGAVGSAARNGLEFLAIYVGPTLVFVGWWWLLRKLVRVGRTQRVTSIADLISSRYGKSNTLAVVVTLLAVVGTTPYIALQLQSLTLSFSVFAQFAQTEIAPGATAFVLALGLAAFTIVFGTRNLDANERHYGVVTAIALEAVIKLIALVSVGIFVVWGVSGGIGASLERIENVLPQDQALFSSRWVTLTFLSATAIICLPRMFQVVVVENSAERHLATASWAFPLYLFLMCIFVMPIAVTGLDILPENSNPDLFVLTIPLASGQNSLAALAFLGGFSSATSMVIVAAIALSTMVSNHIVLPLWLYSAKSRSPESDDVRSVLLRSRRISIACVLALGYLYYTFTGGTSALSSIGLIAFLGVAQVLPALLAGLYWQNATRSAALAAISVGFFLWAYTLFLPSFDGAFILTKSAIENGPLGIGLLRPQSLFGTVISDPLIHATFWSLGLNAVVLVIGSLVTSPSPLERLQARLFVSVFQTLGQRPSTQQFAAAEDLFVLAQRILGRADAAKLFNQTARDQGREKGLPEPSGQFIERLEREFSGSVGAATAHAMIGQVTGARDVSVDDLIAVADETAQIMEYSARLEKQSAELASTAAELRDANQQLTDLGYQKDAFLSQVSHELRTPMTSILSFSEILRDGPGVSEEKLEEFASIIHDESRRLTRLLDEILDLSFLESGRVRLNIEPVKLNEILEQAKQSTRTVAGQAKVTFKFQRSIAKVEMDTDSDRLAQVFINLFSNAIKFCDEEDAIIDVRAKLNGDDWVVTISDNGPGIPEAEHMSIFEKFSRLYQTQGASGVGLGLPISREIMRNLGGDLRCVPSDQGAMFELTVPRKFAPAPEQV